MHMVLSVLHQRVLRVTGPEWGKPLTLNELGMVQADFYWELCLIQSHSDQCAFPLVYLHCMQKSKRNVV